MERERICLSLPRKMLEDMRKVKEETGVSISRQIELGLKGYSINKEGKK